MEVRGAVVPTVVVAVVVCLGDVVGGISMLKSSPFLYLVNGTIITIIIINFLYLVSDVLPWLMEVISLPRLPNLFSLLLVLDLFVVLLVST